VDSVRHGTLLTALFYGYSSVRAYIWTCMVACVGVGKVGVGSGWLTLVSLSPLVHRLID
jgi:hypothetical protein